MSRRSRNIHDSCVARSVALSAATAIAAFVVGNGTASPTFGQASSGVRWQVPDENVTLDFGDAKLAPQPALADEGFAYEVPLEFVFLKHQMITVVAKLPEVGQFVLVTDTPNSAIEIRQTKNEPREAVVEVHNRLPIMGRRELNNQVGDAVEKVVAGHLEKARRDAKDKNESAMGRRLRDFGEPLPKGEPELRRVYVRLLAVEAGKDLMLDAMNELADRRSDWVTSEDRKIWKDATAEERYGAWRRLLEWDMADAHLRRLNIVLTTNARTADTLLMQKFDGLYAFMSGESAQGAEGRNAVRALTSSELARFREALVVASRCRFVPRVDPGDANASWHLGQRVACQGRGIGTVRLEGTVDAAAKDRVDWWRLADYDKDKVVVILPDKEKSGVKAEIIEDRGRAGLRVTAVGDRRASYSIELRRREANKGADVVLRESPAPDVVKFPF